MAASVGRRRRLLPTSTDIVDLLKEQTVDACRRGRFGASAATGATAGGRHWADGKRIRQRADGVDAGEPSSGQRRGHNGWPGSSDPGACRYGR
ncbi:hypothetical protein ACLOJK_012068 [Asimina triloba]